MALIDIKKITNLDLLLSHLCRHFPFRLISDKQYLKLFFKAYQRKPLNLNNPRSYNEKLQWLKLYDRKEIYTTLSDKYRVREYVKSAIGERYLVPLLGVWKNADDIDFATLPEQFVLKCNHDSGSVIVCKDKASLDYKETRRALNTALKRQYYWTSREWNYKNIQRCIIAEKYLSDRESDELTDYKYFCFDGKPAFIQVDSGRFSTHIRNFYDTEWNFIDVSYGCPNDRYHLDQMPKQHEEMLNLASKLSKGMVHVRVDFYVSNDQVYFGELTFHHGGGVMQVSPFKYDLIWGDLIHLPQINVTEK